MTTTAPLTRDTYRTVHSASIANLVAAYGVDTASAMVEAALSATHPDFDYTERMELHAYVAALAPAPTRAIIGTRYTQADRRDRDQRADFATALATGDPLMTLHAMGYDVSTAKVVGA